MWRHYLRSLSVLASEIVLSSEGCLSLVLFPYHWHHHVPFEDPLSRCPLGSKMSWDPQGMPVAQTQETEYGTRRMVVTMVDPWSQVG